MIYSHSQLETYEACPYKYRLLYLERVKAGRRSIEAFMGSLVHAALEKLYLDLRMSRLPDLEDLLRFFLREWEASFGEDVFIVREEYGEEDYRNTGLRCLENYYRRYYPFTGGVPVWLEHRVQIPLRSRQGRQINFTGVIDRLDSLEGDRFEIHDYKTSQTLPTREVLERDRQLSLYQLAVEASFPQAREVELVWHYLTFDRELRLRRDREELEAVASAAAAMVEEIENAVHFPPRESELCDWCEVQEHCPRRKHLYMVAKLPICELGMDRGVQLVDEFSEWYARKREAEEKLEEIREEILEFAAFHGVEKIQGSGKVLSLSRTAKLKLPPPESGERKRLEEILKEARLWEEVSAISPKRLMDALSREDLDKTVRSQVESLVNREEGVTIRLHDKD